MEWNSLNNFERGALDKLGYNPPSGIGDVVSSKFLTDNGQRTS